MAQANTFKITTLAFKVDSATKELRLDVGNDPRVCKAQTEAENGGLVDKLCTQNTAHFMASVSTPSERHILKLALIQALKDLEDF